MSEAERKKRLSYKKRREKWIFIQGVALLIVAMMIFASVVLYNQLNQEIFIEYQESSSAKYSVKIPKSAPFYSDYLDEFSQFADENGDLWIPSNYAYPAMAATTIKVELDYQLNMGTPNVDYEYSYRIFAHPEVIDSASKNKFPMPKTVIFETANAVTQSSNNRLTINKPIEIDYHHYDELVKDFEKKMGIKNATESLVITMEVEVIGSSEVFESNAENTHSIKVAIPLTEDAFDVKYSTSSGQDADCKILARKNSGNQHLYRGAAIVLGVMELLMFIVFVSYVYLTKNHDVNYSIKVRRLVNSYRSFIQQVMNGFDTAGYQMLKIATFKEMLAIRDTIQSPILMSENTDQTRTQFFIPTHTKILYIFEIKVDNYDELYGAHPEWVDDSLIKLESIREEVKTFEPEISDYSEPATETHSESVSDQQNQIIMDLFAEIERLRREIESTKEQKADPVSVPTPVIAPQVIPTPYAAGPVKFGHFTAGGSVTINYNEGPDASCIREAAKIIADNLGDRLSNGNNGGTLSVSTDEPKPEAPAPEAAPEASEEATEPTVEEVPEAVEEAAEPAVEEVTEVVEEATEPTVEEVPEVVEEATEPAVEEVPEVVEEATEPTVEEVPEAAEEATEPIVEEVPEVVEEAAEPAVEEVTEAPHHKPIDLDQVLDALGDDEDGTVLDEQGNPVKIQVRRSFTANIIQADPETVKYFYSELKNYALSFKGVKARMSWRFETFKSGRNQLFRMKIRGKSICLYCALDPEEFDKSKYFHETVDSKMFDGVPMLVKVKSVRGLKRAIELVGIIMQKFGVQENPKAQKVDYISEHPYETTKALVERGLIKILDSDYVIRHEPEATVAKAPDREKFDLSEELATIADMANETLEMAQSAEGISLGDIEFNDEGEIILPEGNKLNIHCKRSFIANLCQSDPSTVKTYYSELKNYVLSFKGVKSRSAWRYESFKKGRNQLFRIRIKGKGLRLYCALDPKDVDGSRYFHDTVTSKDYSDVPTVVKIKTQRGLKRAKELVDKVMTRFDVQPDPKAKNVDYLEIYPFRKTVELVEDGYVKILSDSYSIKEPKAPKVHAAKK